MGRFRSNQVHSDLYTTLDDVSYKDSVGTKVTKKDGALDVEKLSKQSAGLVVAEKLTQHDRSTAYLSSADWHNYRKIRDKEELRVAAMFTSQNKRNKSTAFDRRVEKNRLDAEAKTAKNRAKRQAKKLARAKKRLKKNSGASTVSSTTAATVSSTTAATENIPKTAGQIAYERELAKNKRFKEEKEKAEATNALLEVRKTKSCEPATGRN